MEARLTPIKDGWAAVGHGWAVFGETRGEALERYRDAEAEHAKLLEADWDESGNGLPHAEMMGRTFDQEGKS